MQKSYRSNRKRIAIKIMAIVCAMLLMTTPVFAAGWSELGEAEIGESLKDIYTIARNIGLAAATIVFAYGGLMFFGLVVLSNISAEKAMEMGKKLMITSAFAVAAMLMLPWVLKLAYNLFSGLAWNPPAVG